MTHDFTSQQVWWEWRPISTAPKDEVLMYFARTTSRMPMPAMVRAGRVADFPNRQPTHWMPLPPPPKNEQ